MSLENPYEKLGVAQNASFEEIYDAKQRLSQQYRNDSKIVESIEAAYDEIIMDRLRMRQEGKIKVPDTIRFAEKRSEVAPNFPPTPTTNNSRAWLQNLLDTPSQGEIILPAGYFGILAMITVFSDLNLLSVIMALGVCGNVYFLNRKEQRFGRAVLITLLGLVGGIALGTGLANFLVIGLEGEQLASLVTFVLFWLISSFLR
ncbi:MAG: CPP1-like family protein [Gomphosphaeria aponina SAG 52.96 = DSM 107014]|uniref:CPP1-like family protein n=1 Tax=Gomphosphaeria aponina SAG 52.96 = DSM 107014 TaxID=1521640 RepID=A0A941GQU5_9CHRO|nr:CPP1-like family protein [Gomphosphaeria aponina SAG 52.96 = DSM 107014]